MMVPVDTLPALLTLLSGSVTTCSPPIKDPFTFDNKINDLALKYLVLGLLKLIKLV